MFTITWIENNSIQSVSHPKESVIMSVWFALLAKGTKARFWDKNKALVV